MGRKSRRNAVRRRASQYSGRVGLICVSRDSTLSFNTASPGYLAYIPGGGILHAAVADLIANTTNRYVGVWLAAPLLATLEANVIRWLCQIVNYPQFRSISTSRGTARVQFRD